MSTIGYAIELALSIFIGLMLARFVIEIVQSLARSWHPHGPVLVVLELIFTITDPPIKAFRRVFRPIRLGGVALDLSPMVVLLICYLLLQINRMVFS